MRTVSEAKQEAQKRDAARERKGFTKTYTGPAATDEVDDDNDDEVGTASAVL